MKKERRLDLSKLYTHELITWLKDGTLEIGEGNKVVLEVLRRILERLDKLEK